MAMRSYKELLNFGTYEDRLNYLYLGDKVGEKTFGDDRWINQKFYTSDEWKRCRRDIIVRDRGLNLGLNNMDILGGIIVHHINPITKFDIIERTDLLFNPDNLICVNLLTHNAIHYQPRKSGIFLPTERTPNDTCPWKNT